MIRNILFYIFVFSISAAALAWAAASDEPGLEVKVTGDTIVITQACPAVWQGPVSQTPTAVAYAFGAINTQIVFAGIKRRVLHPNETDDQSLAAMKPTLMAAAGASEAVGTFLKETTKAKGRGTMTCSFDTFECKKRK